MNGADLPESNDSEYLASNEIVIDSSKDKTVIQKKRNLKEKIKELWRNPKKRSLTIIISFGIVLIIFVGTGLYFAMGKNTASTSQPSSSGSQKTKSTTLTTLVPSSLTGVPVDADAANRHPLAVIVENHPDARPQAGLDKADIVYEAIAEGGITRFMAVFGSQEAEKVGPVRSARTFFVDWARGYEAYLAHVGGNIDALDQIRAEHVLDLDQFSYSSPYWRETNKNLAIEHTMYTATGRLWDQAAKNKYATANNFNVMKFKDDPSGTEKDALPASQKVTVDFSNDSYKVVFDYDRTTNSYKRSLAGVPHIDQVDKQQINPKNVIIMTVQRKPTVTRINEAGYDMTTVGSGVAKIFMDGKMITGTWKKASKTDRELFYDPAGNEITFNKGQFWISVVPPEAGVVVQ